MTDDHARPIKVGRSEREGSIFGIEAMLWTSWAIGGCSSTGPSGRQLSMLTPLESASSSLFFILYPYFYYSSLDFDESVSKPATEAAGVRSMFQGESALSLHWGATGM